MSLLIKKAGILTTVQDLGRVGWRRFGVNPNGPMDPVAARVANILVGNDENAAVLEMHFTAAEIVFGADTVFSVCGADFGAELNGERLMPWRAFAATAGCTLSFTKKVAGERCYFAPLGGFDIPRWLGSASTNVNAHIGGHNGRPLRAGDELGVQRHDGVRIPRRFPTVSPSLLPRYSRFPTVRIIPGAEFEYLVDDSRGSLLSQDFTISNNSNRMGFRLEGESLTLEKPRKFISSAVCFGTVQLLPDGQLIILMADQQTAGGYPRIAHIISYDLPLLGQLGAGDKVAFHIVDLSEAERLAVQFDKELSFLRVACKFAYR